MWVEANHFIFAVHAYTDIFILLFYMEDISKESYCSTFIG